MSARRRSPLPPSLERFARELKRCEARVALLDRVRPLNFAPEQARLAQAFSQGERPAVAFEHGPRPDLGQLRRDLTDMARALASGDVEERLLAERACELELEAQLAEHVGTSRFRDLAAQRFPLPADASVNRLAHDFLGAPVASISSAATRHRSDDERDPNSLWSKLSRRVARERWPVRVEMTAGLVSLAAVADGVVRVRPNASLTDAIGERIALHEVEGHVRPRVSGAVLGGVWLAGSARCSEDEEGRAIWLEERAGLLDAERRHELARRYFAVEALRDGSDLWETVEVLEGAGASPQAAVELASRVHRGGGLGREVLYLSGYARVSRAFASEPLLNRVMRNGRSSLDAAQLLGSSLELDDDGDVV